MTNEDKKKLIATVVGRSAPFTVDHADGSWLYSTEGEKWLDFASGIAVANTGHCHPKVVAAAREQIGKINVTEFTTFVAVQRDIALQAMQKLNAGKVKGKSVKVRLL